MYISMHDLKKKKKKKEFNLSLLIISYNFLTVWLLGTFKAKYL